MFANDPMFDVRFTIPPTEFGTVEGLQLPEVLHDPPTVAL
jgi:hypothetical protein